MLTNDVFHAQVIATHALHRNVLCVLVARPGHELVAYVFPVPGERHADERGLWRDHGERLPEAVARAIFGGAIEEAELTGFRCVR